MSGARRLAIAVSIAWVGFWFFGYYTDPYLGVRGIGPFPVIGVCPVAIPWASWWVLEPYPQSRATMRATEPLRCNCWRISLFSRFSAEYSSRHAWHSPPTSVVRSALHTNRVALFCWGSTSRTRTASQWTARCVLGQDRIDCGEWSSKWRRLGGFGASGARRRTIFSKKASSTPRIVDEFSR